MTLDEREDYIFRALVSAKAPVVADALAEATGVSVRTIYREIGELRAAGLPIQGQTGRGLSIDRYSVLKANGIGLSLDEVIAVTVTLADVLGPDAEHLDSTRWRKLHSARERLLDALPEVVRRYVEHVVEASTGRDAPP